MPTRAAIQEAKDDGGLREIDVEWLLPTIKSSAIYMANPGQFPDLEEDLRGLIDDGDSWQGAKIRATCDGYEDLGDNQVELKGGRNAVYFNLAENRDLMAVLILNILYDLALELAPTSNNDTAIGVMYAGECCTACTRWPCVCLYPRNYY